MYRWAVPISWPADALQAGVAAARRQQRQGLIHSICLCQAHPCLPTQLRLFQVRFGLGRYPIPDTRWSEPVGALSGRRPGGFPLLERRAMMSGIPAAPFWRILSDPQIAACHAAIAAVASWRRATSTSKPTIASILSRFTSSKHTLSLNTLGAALRLPSTSEAPKGLIHQNARPSCRGC